MIWIIIIIISICARSERQGKKWENWHKKTTTEKSAIRTLSGRETTSTKEVAEMQFERQSNKGKHNTEPSHLFRCKKWKRVTKSKEICVQWNEYDGEKRTFMWKFQKEMEAVGLCVLVFSLGFLPLTLLPIFDYMRLKCATIHVYGNVTTEWW